MDSAGITNIKRVIEMLGFQNKTHLSRKETDQLVEELTLNRDYHLADYVRALDPVDVDAELLR